MANELKIPHIVVSSVYMAVQAIITVGFVAVHRCGYGYEYLLATILLLSLAYVLFMKKYFHLHQNKTKTK